MIDNQLKINVHRNIININDQSCLSSFTESTYSK